jgi:hypothetical protein
MPLRPRHREQSQLWDRQGSSDNPRPDRRAKVELRSNGHKFYGGGCGITTGEERVADWKILVHHGRHERSFRDELSPHLVFTKNDEEPGYCDEDCAIAMRTHLRTLTTHDRRQEGAP